MKTPFQAVWFVSCLTTMFTTVTAGLFISILFVIFTVVLRQQWPKFHVHGTNEAKTAFASEKKYTKINGISSQVILLKFESPLHFVNVARFLSILNPILNESDDLEEVKVGSCLEKVKKNIILDCTAISFIDTMGLDAILQSYKTAQKKNSRLIFAGFCNAVLETLEKTESFEIIDKKLVFPSVVEAVDYIAEQ